MTRCVKPWVAGERELRDPHDICAAGPAGKSDHDSLSGLLRTRLDM